MRPGIAGALLLVLTGLTGCSGEADTPEPVVEVPAEPAEPAAPKFTPDAQLAAAIAGVPEEWRTKPNPASGDAAAATGAALYEKHCAACHGVNGDGDGPAARALPQPPSDFTDDDRWAATSIGEKAWLTMKGIPRTSMAPRDLTEEETWATLLHVENNFQ